MMERTDWFPKDVHPVHIGWYERYYEAIDGYPSEVYQDYWSGTWWFMQFHKGKPSLPCMTARPWRGVEDPS